MEEIKVCCNDMANVLLDFYGGSLVSDKYIASRLRWNIVLIEKYSQKLPKKLAFVQELYALTFSQCDDVLIKSCRTIVPQLCQLLESE